MPEKGVKIITFQMQVKGHFSGFKLQTNSLGTKQEAQRDSRQRYWTKQETKQVIKKNK